MESDIMFLELDFSLDEESVLTETIPDMSTYMDQNGNLQPFSVINSDDIAYSNFYKEYLIGNRPCLFTREITRNWKAMLDLTVVDTDDFTKPPTTTQDYPKTINYDFLIRKYGGCTVSVTNCDQQANDYDNPSCDTMSLKEYIEYMRQRRQLSSSMPCLYLKDWHVVSCTNPVDEMQPYIVPKFFASDWLNETALEQGDDFRFAYIGPKGSWTPLHADVYGSFSWSANIIGTKKWFLYPPGKEDRFKKNGKYQFDKANQGVQNHDFYEVIQEAGEIIFVPSGWYHIVWNLEDTISINHNWINGSNAGYIWANLKSALTDVKAELDDLKNDPEFDALCQGLLKANHGMNYHTFRQILSSVAANRVGEINYMKDFRLGPNHVNYDLSVIKFLSKAMRRHDEYLTMTPQRTSTH